MSDQRIWVSALQERGLSERRACRVLAIERNSIRYTPAPEDPINTALRPVLGRLVARHRRFGSPRLTWRVQRDGWAVNHKRVERLYAEAGWQIPRRRKRPRAVGPRWVRTPRAQGPNDVWAMDFVHDQTVTGTKLKCLAVVDEGGHECLELRVDWRLRSRDVLETLDELVQERGVPQYLRTDNGPEFIAEELRTWAASQGIRIAYTDPGSPWQNGIVESFNGKLRDECLNGEVFWSRTEAQVVLDRWRDEYNRERPHRSLGMRTPAEVAAAHGID